MKNIMNKLLQNLATRIMLIIFICLIAVVGVFLSVGYYNDMRLQEQRQYDKLSAITATLAVNLNGGIHDKLIQNNQSSLSKKYILKDSLYNVIQADLQIAFEINNLKSALYTLIYDSVSQKFRYGVRSDEYNDFMNEYVGSPIVLKEQFEVGGVIPKYKSVNGIWLSAFHPIKDENGKVVAILEADVDFTEFKSEVNWQYLKESMISLVAIIFMSLFFILYARKILIGEYKNKLLLAKKNKIIQAKNRDIIDSFHYAQKIQAAILPSKLEFDKTFEDSFIFYVPKELVSGDFYWHEKVGDDVFFAVADCTGHGVPGSILTIICANALNFVVNVNKLKNTGEILDAVRIRVIDFLAKGGHNINDGMDIAICRYNKASLMLQYSGAYNPVYIFSENEFIVTKPCKQPVGRYLYTKNFEYSNHQLSKGDSLYLFSDGFSDQFGGPKNKKFKYKQFKSLISENKNKPFEIQKDIFTNTFNDWKGECEQIDDVCILGLKI